MKRSILSAVMILLSGFAFAQQKQGNELPANWYNLDLKANGVFGISIDKSYSELLKGKKPVSVIVAVIDGGIDPKHEDLKNVVWTNPKEIPGNGKDDDKNGYIDDIHGWNFLGSSKDDFEYDNDLIVVEVRKGKAKFGDKDSTAIAKKDLPAYREYIAKREDLKGRLENANQKIESTNTFLTDVNALQKKLAKDQPTLEDFKNYVPSTDAEAKAQQFMVRILQKNPSYKAYMEQTKEQLEEYQHDAQYHLNINYDPRAKYANEFTAAKGRFYGNGNVYGAVPPAHGTHVAGVIAAQRNNNIGINGVADAVQLMAIRAIPDGYGLDKDEANAIRYAADNGAKVINMSFGLSTAIDKKMVEDAVKYALSKDILFIQAAGNGHDNLDLNTGYPDRKNPADQDFTDAFIKVGASGISDDEHLAVPFSNFGKRSVDVFAPGLGINSTIPGNHYEAHSGTSMAAPVVAGMAAVIREYYPKLTAKQVKEIIMKTVIKRDTLKELCISGGVVNAYDALKLAATY